MMLQPPLPQQDKSARIEPLAVLPVFLDLHGKKAIVVGVSEGALWKAELLLQAGASVTLVCERPTAAALQWTGTVKTNRITIAASHWREISFADAAVVVADVAKPEAAALAAKAREAGALINIVDQPAHCQFQFGSIVNKSPLVIGISTGGAAPVLAQLVRGLIESALPFRVEALAQKAFTLRTRINQRLKSANERRRYWNAFFGRAFGKMSQLHGDRAQPYSITAANVGDLTLRDLEMLRRAETLTFGPRSSSAIIALARREARRLNMPYEDPGQDTGKIVLTFDSQTVDDPAGENKR